MMKEARARHGRLALLVLFVILATSLTAGACGALEGANTEDSRSAKLKPEQGREEKRPEDNPFGDSPIFTIGLRNVFGMSFDARGRLVATESGPRGDDEINLIRRGADYGRPTATGSVDTRFSDPLVTFRQAIAHGKAEIRIILDLGEGVPALAVSANGSLYVATESAIRPVEAADILDLAPPLNPRYSTVPIEAT